MLDVTDFLSPRQSGPDCIQNGAYLRNPDDRRVGHVYSRCWLVGWCSQAKRESFGLQLSEGTSVAKAHDDQKMLSEERIQGSRFRHQCTQLSAPSWVWSITNYVQYIPYTTMYCSPLPQGTRLSSAPQSRGFSSTAVLVCNSLVIAQQQSYHREFRIDFEHGSARTAQVITPKPAIESDASGSSNFDHRSG